MMEFVVGGRRGGLMKRERRGKRQELVPMDVHGTGAQTRVQVW
jgi:hypothetical protein